LAFWEHGQGGKQNHATAPASSIVGLRVGVSFAAGTAWTNEQNFDRYDTTWHGECPAVAECSNLI
jgi:hypothetical protein